jgi:hypothetical protein
MSDATYEALALSVQHLMARLSRLEERVRLRPEVDPVPFERPAYGQTPYAGTYRSSAASIPEPARWLPHADPAPWPPYADPAPWPPYADPPPWWWAQRAQAYRWGIPQPGDPPAFDMARWRELGALDLVDAVARMGGVESAQVKLEDLRNVRLSDLLDRLKWRFDPPPEDWRRSGRLAWLTAAQIEAMNPKELSALSKDIGAEITRLQSLQAMVGERAGG